MPDTFYRCGVCKREHHTYVSAVRCEQSHLEITSSHIRSYGMWVYPQEIEVTFSNGETRLYLAERLK